MTVKSGIKAGLMAFEPRSGVRFRRLAATPTSPRRYAAEQPVCGSSRLMKAPGAFRRQPLRLRSLANEVSLDGTRSHRDRVCVRSRRLQTACVLRDKTRAAFSSYGEAVFCAAIAALELQNVPPCTTGLPSVPIPSIVIRTRSSGFKAEIIGRHDPGSGQQNDTVGKRLSLPSQSIRSSKRAGHPGDARFALENRDCRPFDLHPDADLARGGIAAAA